MCDDDSNSQDDQGDDDDDDDDEGLFVSPSKVLTAIQAWETLDLHVSHTSLMSHPLSTSNVTYQFHLTFPFSTEDEFAPPL